MDLPAKFKDAQRLIKEGRAKDACGVLRPILEAYLKKLCAEKKASPSNTNLGNMIHALYNVDAINDIDKGKFLTWTKFGNAGSHAGTEEIKPRDAEYFLSSLADIVDFSLDQDPKSATPFFENRSAPAARVCASGTQLHRQALISAFYLSKFDHHNLRTGNQRETFSTLAKALSANVNTLKNYRDYFDPHTGSHRKGWWQVEMPPQFADIFQEFKNYEESLLREMVLGFIGK